MIIAVALLAWSEPAWGFLGVVVTGLFGLLSVVVVQQHRQGREISAVNRAVNHQPPEMPTLVERVAAIEARTEVIETATFTHREWEHEAFQALADQVGCELPPHPKG